MMFILLFLLERTRYLRHLLGRTLLATATSHADDDASSGGGDAPSLAKTTRVVAARARAYTVRVR